jgi:hypothetical protein
MDHDRSVLLFLPLSPIWSDGLRQICSEYLFEPTGLGFANIANICQFPIRPLLNFLFMFDPYLFKIYLKAIFPIDRCLSIIGSSQVSRRVSYVHVGLVGPT